MMHAYDYRINPEKTGLRIRKLRLERGYSIADMKEFFNCSVQTIYRWENGTSLPSAENQYSLSRLFRVSLDELIVGEAVMPDAA